MKSTSGVVTHKARVISTDIQWVVRALARELQRMCWKHTNSPDRPNIMWGGSSPPQNVGSLSTPDIYTYVNVICSCEP